MRIFLCCIRKSISSKYIDFRTEKSLNFVFQTYPKVVIVTMVYQNAAGIDVKFVPATFFSA